MKTLSFYPCVQTCQAGFAADAQRARKQLPPLRSPVKQPLLCSYDTTDRAREQVWRPDDQNPDNFQLVCDNAVSALEIGLNEFDIPDVEQCTVLPNDSIGWSQRPSQSGVISYTEHGATDDDVVRFR